MIKTATARALEAIARLNRVVHEFHAQNAPSHFKPPSGTEDFLSWFSPVLHESESVVLVAVDTDAVVGYLYAKEVRKTESWVRPASHVFLLHHIVVDAAFQGHGHGTSLMNALFEEGERRGIPNVELDVWSFNETARRFFSKFGFIVLNQKMGTSVSQAKHLTQD